MTKRQFNANVRRALATLRRIPDDVILAMGTVEYSMGAGQFCVVGWALRQDVLAATGEDNAHGTAPDAKARFGGTLAEWDNIFSGVCYDTREPSDDRKLNEACLPEIELAFVQRMDEAVRRA